ncbi:MAG: hypothetical protein ABL985_04790 [Casimicrobium sp.]
MLKLVVGVVKMAIKGENLYSTVQGIVENVQTIADPTASTGEKALAALSIVMDVTSGINVKDVRAVGSAVKDGIARIEGGAAKQTLHKEIGSYTNHHASGKTYDGKGDRQRSQVSGKRVEKETKDKHVATEWTPASNEREAFKQESVRLDSHGGPGAGSGANHNKIQSPGKKMREQDGE